MEDKKKIAALIIGQIKPKAEEEKEKPDTEIIAEDVLKAVENNDATSLADALTAFFDALWAENEEMDTKEEEKEPLTKE